MDLGDQLAGAEAMHLVVPVPQDVAVHLHSSWRPPAAGEARPTTMVADEARTAGSGGDVRSCLCLTECRVGLCVQLEFRVLGTGESRSHAAFVR